MDGNDDFGDRSDGVAKEDDIRVMQGVKGRRRIATTRVIATLALKKLLM
jgi:hypothetical protein